MQDRLNYEALERLLAKNRGGPHHGRAKRKSKVGRCNKPAAFTSARARCGIHGIAFANRYAYRPFNIAPVPAPADDSEARRRYASIIDQASLSAAGIMVLPRHHQLTGRKPAASTLVLESRALEYREPAA